MRNRLPKALVVLVFALLLFSAGQSNAEPVRVGHVQAELISSVETIKPGESFYLGLRLTMDEYWHVYWRNPGDAGVPPTIEWTLPDGFVAGDIQWPVPERIAVPPLSNYGYEGSLLLPVLITPPEAIESDRVGINAHAEWLVCKEKCIPGETDLEIDLDVGDESSLDENWIDRFDETLEGIPGFAEGWSASLEYSDETLYLAVEPSTEDRPLPDDIWFAPYEKSIIDYSKEQTIEVGNGIYTIEIVRSPYSMGDVNRVDGILVSDTDPITSDGAYAVRISAAADSDTTETPVAAASTGWGDIWKAVAFAFIGGIILNLMPCVLPVLSLKVMSFVRHSDEVKGSALRHGILFGIGVLVSFWALAGVLIALRAGGDQIGWGFQLQSPAFVVILASVMFLLALNMLGVFEIRLGLGGSSSGGRSGLFGSFLTGIIATVVATPCTAPFMGTALGFSLTQPITVSLAVFTSLGLGMAAPYVVLTAFPFLLKYVPKPGRWMETLKQVLGFVLLGSVVWLAWVLGSQAGHHAMTVLLLSLLLMGIGAWIYGRWNRLNVSDAARRIAGVVSLVVLAGSVAFALTGISHFSGPVTTASAKSGGIAWETFAPSKVDELLSAGKHVFIDFTAAWCLSCQVNEKVAFSSREVQSRFEELDVVPLKADWTSRDETITKALAKFGRNSVPLYVLYEKGKSKPRILPEILTPGIVMDALKGLETNRKTNVE